MEYSNYTRHSSKLRFFIDGKSLFRIAGKGFTEYPTSKKKSCGILSDSEGSLRLTQKFFTFQASIVRFFCLAGSDEDMVWWQVRGERQLEKKISLSSPQKKQATKRLRKFKTCVNMQLRSCAWSKSYLNAYRPESSPFHNLKVSTNK